jgi:hypothetical protein
MFELALQFANFTGRHFFLTGKAGTGKTTFLQYLRKHSRKKMAVVAPTGVAAINAGGMTIHSFFQLPFGPFIPAPAQGWGGPAGIANNKHSLLKNLRLNSNRRQLIQELELVVIDEVSMVRADMLDAIDLVLRHVRRKQHLPFGGVQMIYIGDLFQLPPVASREEWSILAEYYSSPFFFDALVIKEANPLFLELTHIYRQRDEHFIALLEKIRNNNPSAADLDLLHQHYEPGFIPAKEENYITLTTHNYKADAINKRALDELPGRPASFKAKVDGEFAERAYPADFELVLKIGAQVMFIKNDKGESRRYYNGKIGVISRMSDTEVYVEFPGEPEEVLVEKEQWKNIRYAFNKEQQQVDEEELGTYEQFPLRLAWAITIHKSQGLTFDKAVIDAGESFAAGQVYVALSRLRSMEGLVLQSRIRASSIHTDDKVLAFSNRQHSHDELKVLLEAEQQTFIGNMLIDTFSFVNLESQLSDWNQKLEASSVQGKDAAISWVEKQLGIIDAQQEIARKFNTQLERILSTDTESLVERTKAGAAYFGKIVSDMKSSLKELRDMFAVKSKVKKFLAELDETAAGIERKRWQLEHSWKIAEGLLAKTPVTQILESMTVKPVIVVAQPKAKVGETRFVSLELFRQQLSISAIASKRGMTESTIETHLASFMESGEIRVYDLMPEATVEAIVAAFGKYPGQGLASLKQQLDPSITYNQLRIVRQYLDLLRKQATISS